MKRNRIVSTAAAAVLALGLSHQAHAEGREWTNSQLAWGAAGLALTAIDWGQTRNISRNPDRFKELNPLVGEHPSLGQVNRHFIVSAALIGLAAHYLPEYRDVILKMHVGLQVANTARNFSIGLRVEF